MCEEKDCRQVRLAVLMQPVQAGDTFQMAIHLAENITDVDWHLSYQSMECVTPLPALSGWQVQDLWRAAVHGAKALWGQHHR